MFKAVQRAAGASRLELVPRCDEQARALGYDAEEVMDVIANFVELDDVVLCEHDDQPMRPFHVMAFQVEVEERSPPFYIKVALWLPELERGRVLSFHLCR